ncbi:MAG TPA: hypothetical protein VJ599_08320, partial [Nitrososphaeraceae archaeon]|nr:hypothetical protein [Nitrososphaeraceae archaeon]
LLAQLDRPLPTNRNETKKIPETHQKLHPADINSIIELLAQLDRPLPTNRNETKKIPETHQKLHPV